MGLRRDLSKLRETFFKATEPVPFTSTESLWVSRTLTCLALVVKEYPTLTREEHREAAVGLAIASSRVPASAGAGLVEVLRQLEERAS